MFGFQQKNISFTNSCSDLPGYPKRKKKEKKKGILKRKGRNFLLQNHDLLIFKPWNPCMEGVILGAYQHHRTKSNKI